MRKLWIPGVLAVVISATVSAQAILEYGAAAAGGTTAGVAGKKVSDSLDKVMNKVSDLAKSGASDDQKPRKMAPTIPPAPEVRIKDLNLATEKAGKSKVTATPVRRQANLQATPAAKQPDLPAVPQPGAEPATPATPPPSATVEDLKSLDGASREDVLSKMGKPASRITMTDDRGLVETYSFKNSNGNLGSVRIINGKVAEVRPAQ